MFISGSNHNSHNSAIRLSIIVPCYNMANLLTNLLESIPFNPDAEVIVVDDHSTMYLKEYRD